MNLDLLKIPFEPNEIEWRVQQAGENNGKPWARVLAYVTNRAIMDRLDTVCGPGNWQNKFETGPDGGILCGISIKINNEWITKWDGAANTQVEPVKGGLSNAQKRAAVQWGIGRYLYSLDAAFAVISDSGKYYQNKGPKVSKPFRWDAPKLPQWALPKEPPPQPKTISEPKRKALEARISQYDLTLDRNKIKAYCAAQFGVEHFADLTDEAYNRVMTLINKKINEVNKTPPPETQETDDIPAQ